MTLRELWNKLEKPDRIALVVASYPLRSAALAEFESTFSWDKLLPSTQWDLQAINWSKVLDRDLFEGKAELI